MILEGLVTTLNADGSIHLAAMGPRVEPDWRRMVLRPYSTSSTLANLRTHGEGVLHVTDDVELIARVVTGDRTLPATIAAEGIRGARLLDTCRWYSFRVESLDESAARAEIIATVVAEGTVRDFFGFNRAKHAVIEACILASRTQFIPQTELQEQLSSLAPLVEKTGGEAEHRAWQIVFDYIEQAYRQSAPAKVGAP